MIGLPPRVARRRDHHDAVIPGIVHRGFLTQAVRGRAQAHVDHARAVVGGVDDGSNQIFIRPKHVRRREKTSTGMMVAPPAMPGDADAVVDPRGRDPRHMRPVAVIINQMSVIAIREVPAVDVIDEAVGIIIDAVVRDLPRVGPDTRRKIRVIRVDTSIKYGDDDIGSPCGVVPGGGHFQPIQVRRLICWVVWVVGRRVEREGVIRLRPLDGGACLQGRGGGSQFRARAGFGRRQRQRSPVAGSCLAPPSRFARPSVAAAAGGRRSLNFTSNWPGTCGAVQSGVVGAAAGFVRACSAQAQRPRAG